MEKPLKKRGHKVFSVDWDKKFKDIALYKDIGKLTANRVIKLCGGVPDVIWASPDCTSYSIAGIHHHRRLNKETKNLDPISDYAKFCDKVNKHVLDLIQELKPKFYFIENPRGGLRKMDFMKGLYRYTISYCQYELDKPVEERRMKPTDIWTNYSDPKFKPCCKNGDPCHQPAPRGAQTGTQGIQGKERAVDRAVIPTQLCEHIVDICEEVLGVAPLLQLNLFE